MPIPLQPISFFAEVLDLMSSIEALDPITNPARDRIGKVSQVGRDALVMVHKFATDSAYDIPRSEVASSSITPNLRVTTRLIRTTTLCVGTIRTHVTRAMTGRTGNSIMLIQVLLLIRIDTIRPEGLSVISIIVDAHLFNGLEPRALVSLSQIGTSAISRNTANVFQPNRLAMTTNVIIGHVLIEMNTRPLVTNQTTKVGVHTF